MKKKVILGMSGGVDSSAACYMLKKEGYEVIGVFLVLWNTKKLDEALNDAKSVASKLGIDLKVLDYRKEFNDLIVSYFIEEYKKGNTPNPCVECNKFVKWKYLFDTMKHYGADYVSTGHYAKISRDESGKYVLSKSKDVRKDQTYVLYNMTQDDLSKILFPLSDITKDEARKLVEKEGLLISGKKDSQEICFIENDDYKSFLQEYGKLVSVPGNFVDTKGNILGMHEGITGYTIGQRKGFKISFGKPKYVVDKNIERNEVVLGDDNDLFKSDLIASNFNFISGDVPYDKKLEAKIRYSQNTSEVVIKRTKEYGKILCTFTQKQRAISPGQSIVFYDGDILIGGGVIDASL